MMRSLFSGVSGLGIHQTKMDVIANNISNVNTIGFKSGTVTFSDVYSQKVSGATMPNDATGRGGTNPMQIGLGAGLAAITNLMSSGTPQRTNQASDLMIEGEGFFIVGDETGTYFTRAGAFVLDKEGYLTLDGRRLQGWMAIDDQDNPGQQEIVQGRVDALNITGNQNASVPAQATSLINYEGNLNSAKTPQKENTLTIFDSVGNSFLFNTLLSYDGSSGDWTYSIDPVAIVNGNPDVTSTFNTSAADITLRFEDGVPVDSGGNKLGSANFNEDDWRVELIFPDSPIGTDANGNTIQYNSSFNDVTVDFTGLESYNITADATAVTKDGYTAGKLQGYSIGTDGKITGSYTNGTTKLLGQIPIAYFSNPAGLEKVGNSLYTTSVNSGDFDGVGIDVQAKGGNMRSGVLEMSNVDLATEFTTMITTQRGFQANSRTITTSDDMLQELVNLKR